MIKQHLTKVVVIGDSGVGKTSLLKQYMTKTFSPQYKATIGSDFLQKFVVIDDKKVSLQLWDTAGQEVHMSLGTAFYKGSDCCVIVYDITNPKSFERIAMWKEEFLNQASPKDAERFPFVLLGNKLDKESERKISTGKANEWCKLNGTFPFFEVSAKDNSNVEEAFDKITRCGLEYQTQSVVVPYNTGETKKLHLHNKKPDHSKKKCC
jgi:Ras-related protein Rab-7A